MRRTGNLYLTDPAYFGQGAPIVYTPRNTGHFDVLMRGEIGYSSRPVPVSVPSPQKFGNLNSGAVRIGSSNRRRIR